MSFGSFRIGERFTNLLRRPLHSTCSERFIYSLLPKSRHHLWLISPPKSGSTWLSAILKNYLGWSTCPLTKSYDRREQEPSVQALGRTASLGNVLSDHQHTRVSAPTIEMIRKARIWPIIQTRNISDSLISLRDHFNNESTICSMAYLEARQWEQMDDAAKLQFVVDMAAPWYFNFYAGWFASELVRDNIAYVCSYEDLKRDPCSELKNICRHFKLPYHAHKAQAAVELTVSQDTRLNRGIVGRGAELTDEQMAALKRMRTYYSQIDFSSVGLLDESDLPSLAQRSYVTPYSASLR